MVIVYKVLARYRTLQGHSYSEIGYYLERGIAYRKAMEYFDKRGKLSTVDKVIVQELSVGPHDAGIRNIDFISDQEADQQH